MGKGSIACADFNEVESAHLFSFPGFLCPTCNCLAKNPVEGGGRGEITTVSQILDICRVVTEIGVVERRLHKLLEGEGRVRLCQGGNKVFPGGGHILTK